VAPVPLGVAAVLLGRCADARSPHELVVESLDRLLVHPLQVDELTFSGALDRP
jgi:hypothetical protein